MYRSLHYWHPFPDGFNCIVQASLWYKYMWYLALLRLHSITVHRIILDGCPSGGECHFFVLMTSGFIPMLNTEIYWLFRQNFWCVFSETVNVPVNNFSVQLLFVWSQCLLWHTGVILTLPLFLTIVSVLFHHYDYDNYWQKLSRLRTCEMTVLQFYVEHKELFETWK